MGGACSTIDDNEVYKQEQYVRRNFNRYSNQLKGKYSDNQIESKIRQKYYNIDTISKNTYISDSDWSRAKRRVK